MRALTLVVGMLVLWKTQGVEGRMCFNCSSVNDHYCPELMSSEDGDIVSYVACDSINDGRFCIKTTGVNGGASSIRCFRCDDTRSSDDCSDMNLYAGTLSDCGDVFEAYYCIKTIQEAAAGSLGTTRFCSSRDMGNYCEYIRRPGDQLEYRSCVFTCESDGCNDSNLIPASFALMTVAVVAIIVQIPIML